MIKIGIMGAQGTGKTTLSYQLVLQYKKANRNKRVMLTPEVARNCPFPINLHTTKTAQKWIWHKQLLEEIQSSYKADVLICERTVIDNLVYAKHAGLDNMFHMHITEALYWLYSYDQLIWLRPAYALSDDEERSGNEKFQKSIDLIFEEWIKKYKIKTINSSNIPMIKEK